MDDQGAKPLITRYCAPFQVLIFWQIGVEHFFGTTKGFWSRSVTVSAVALLVLHDVGKKIKVHGVEMVTG